MSSEKFEDLEDELKTLQEDISGKITNKIPRLTGGKSEQPLVLSLYSSIYHINAFFLYVPELRKSTIREVEKKIEDAKLIVSVAPKITWVWTAQKMRTETTVFY